MQKKHLTKKRANKTAAKDLVILYNSGETGSSNNCTCDKCVCDKCNC